MISVRRGGPSRTTPELRWLCVRTANAGSSIDHLGSVRPAPGSGCRGRSRGCGLPATGLRPCSGRRANGLGCLARSPGLRRRMRRNGVLARRSELRFRRGRVRRDASCLRALRRGRVRDSLSGRHGCCRIWLRLLGSFRYRLHDGGWRLIASNRTFCRNGPGAFRAPGHRPLDDAVSSRGGAGSARCAREIRPGGILTRCGRGGRDVRIGHLYRKSEGVGSLRAGAGSARFSSRSGGGVREGGIRTVSSAA